MILDGWMTGIYIFQQVILICFSPSIQVEHRALADVLTTPSLLKKIILGETLVNLYVEE